MNDGLAILAGWLQWAALVVVLVVAVLRDVAGHHDQRDVTYERRADGPAPDGAGPAMRSPGGARLFGEDREDTS